VAVQRLSNSGRSGFSYKSLIAGITPLPSVPTIGAATAVNFESVNVAFTAPGAYAGSTFTATSSPGGLTGTSATSPILVSGLSELTEYTFTVTATNATGTSGASAASSPVTTPTGDTGVMFPIQMVSVGAAGAANITFTSIPSTYTHLQIRGITRDARSVSVNTLNMRVGNGSIDSGSNYSIHSLDGDGSSAVAAGTASQTAMTFMIEPGASGTANAFSSYVIDILDYKNTNKYKTFRGLGGTDLNGSGNINLVSSNWMSTSAITNIQFFNNANANFVQYSTFALYGIKGA
jgi:hypothetical protein